MHARRAPLAVEICDGLNRLVVIAGVFLFTLAMAAAALQGTGPRTVEVNFPDRTQVQTESAPTSAAPTP